MECIRFLLKIHSTEINETRSKGQYSLLHVLHSLDPKYKIVSEYDQEIPQSQTADKPREEEPRNNYETSGRQTE